MSIADIVVAAAVVDSSAVAVVIVCVAATAIDAAVVVAVVEVVVLLQSIFLSSGCFKYSSHVVALLDSPELEMTGSSSSHDFLDFSIFDFS